MEIWQIVVAVWATLLVLIITWIKLARRHWMKQIEALGLRCTQQRPLLASGSYGGLATVVEVRNYSADGHGNVPDKNHRSATRSVTYYRITGSTQLRLLIVAKDWGNAIAASPSGLSVLPSGDAAFDARYWLYGVGQTAAVVADPRFRQLLLQMPTTRDLGGLCELQVADGTASLAVQGAEHKPQQMREALDLAASLARAL